VRVRVAVPVSKVYWTAIDICDYLGLGDQLLAHFTIVITLQSRVMPVIPHVTLSMSTQESRHYYHRVQVGQ